jgi:hypothetical protein
MLRRDFSPGSVGFGDANADAMHPASLPVGAAARRSGNVIMENLWKLKSTAPGGAARKRFAVGSWRGFNRNLR